MFSELFVERDMGSRWLKPVLMNFQKQKNYRDKNVKIKGESPKETGRNNEKKAAKKIQDRKRYITKKTEELKTQRKKVTEDIKKAKKSKKTQAQAKLEEKRNKLTLKIGELRKEMKG